MLSKQISCCIIVFWFVSWSALGAHELPVNLKQWDPPDQFTWALATIDHAVGIHGTPLHAGPWHQLNYSRKPLLQGQDCLGRPSMSQLVAHRKLQALGRARRLGLAGEPCPSEQGGHSSLWPQGVTATSLSVGTANKTSADVDKG